MPKGRLGHAFMAVLLLVAMLVQGTWALAGTTGGISGTLTDSTTGKPVAQAKITALSPSQTATTMTDAGGRFNFLNLAPDTYTLSADKDGFTPATVGGVTVFADQSLTVSLATQPQLKTIAKITSRAAGNLVKPGTTADVYSVNAATQQVVSSSGGGFNLNQAYSGIYSQPGVTSYIGNAGWGQVFYIRGSAYSQVGYEFDGVPVNRAFDNYQANSLSSLGQQELQVYTGGSPSGASSATLGGFINQVIKTGTYPGFGSLKGGLGIPGFYHAVTAEAGGANPNRTFSYYVGLQGYNQHFPAGSWSNLSNLDPSGMNGYGIHSGYELATITGALSPVSINENCSARVDPALGNTYSNACLAASGNAGIINGNMPDFNLATCAVPDPNYPLANRSTLTGTQCGWAGQFANGPFQACQRSGPNAGTPVGYSATSPGPFNGVCNGYFPFAASLSDIHERDTVLNFHFAIPHKYDSGRDDLQLLYDNSYQMQLNGDAIVDAGGMSTLNNLLTPFGAAYAGGSNQGLCGYENALGMACATAANPIPFLDSQIFAPGTAFGQTVASAKVVPYYFPNSPTNRQLNTPFAPTVGIPTDMKDGFNNDVSIIKAQYTKNIGTNAYARLFGYTFYSDWLIGGAPGAGVCYIDGLLCAAGGPGWDGTADYELTTHTRGAEFQFADQINPQNLLRFTANYTTASVARWNNGSWESGYAGSRKGVTDWTNGDPNNPVCYRWKPATLPDGTKSYSSVGQAWSCDNSNSYGTFAAPTPADLTSATYCGSTATPGALAATPGCQSFLAGKSNWLVTVPSGQGTYNTVRPVFTSFALEDEFKPNDKLDLNVGLRLERYQYNLADLSNTEFNFWFNAYAKILCYDPGTGLPQYSPLGLGQPVPPNLITTSRPLGSCGTAPSGKEGLHPVGSSVTCDNVTTFDCGPLQYTAQSPSNFTRQEFSPRIGGTYTLNPDTVLRFSAGKYTQPTETAFEQYADQSGKRAANFDFSRFWGLGFHTPAHDNPVQYSNNYDFSVEHHFHGSDITAKVSPFYRDTRNQIETVVLGPGFVSGTNTGHQHSYGIELGIQKGDPTRDGLSGGISYTYTKALVQYGNLPNGTNGIDYLNNYITAFNGLTKAGGGSPCYDGGNPVACPANFATSPTTVVNPYYNMSQQGLLDRNGWYQTFPNEAPNAPYDQGSGGGVSAIWPHQFNGWLQWKHGKLAIAPNITLESGAYYGSPTDVYGIDPRACAQNETAARDASGAAIATTATSAGNCDFLTASATGVTDSGLLAIPNPYTGTFDTVGKYQEPWQLNIGALIKYEISPRVTANLSLANIYNTCYGGTKTPWSTAFKAGQYVCGYGSSNGTYIGPQSGQPGFGGGFFYGDSPASAANGSPNYPSYYNYPFAPFTGALPFQAYLELQIKL